ncbi:hypothetical protein C8Q75DRAFT_785132 [Abortiporus biennis]|nr:hypothetical protein C8Q75DRAFT_785132 [Abortiporus biennis]
MAQFSDLPPEIVEQILLELDPLDVDSVSRTCKAYAFQIYDPSNHVFWRSLFLAQPVDDLRQCVDSLGRPIPPTSINWMKSLQRFIRARIVINRDIHCSPEEGMEIIKTLLGLATIMRPAHNADSDPLSLNPAWLVSHLNDGYKFLDNPLWEPSEEELVLRAKFRTFYGLTFNDYRPRELTKSRALVYTMRNYRPINDYGPYLRDGSGRVDWQLLRSIHHVMSMHIVPPSPTDIDNDNGKTIDHGFTIYPMSIPFCQGIIPSGLDLDKEQDWAGITGLWQCSFCFVDHRDLLVYNNVDAAEREPLDASIFDNPSFAEIYRSIYVKLHITSTEPDPLYPTRPRIHFAGEIDTETQAEMKGWVGVIGTEGKEENIRWHFQSGDPGNLVWSSEGVQLGSIRSTYGILGVWTTTDHDRHDPVGPFWMRKLGFDPEVDDEGDNLLNGHN